MISAVRRLTGVSLHGGTATARTIVGMLVMNRRASVLIPTGLAMATSSPAATVAVSAGSGSVMVMMTATMDPMNMRL